MKHALSYIELRHSPINVYRFDTPIYWGDIWVDREADMPEELRRFLNWLRQEART